MAAQGGAAASRGPHVVKWYFLYEAGARGQARLMFERTIKKVAMLPGLLTDTSPHRLAVFFPLDGAHLVADRAVVRHRRLCAEPVSGRHAGLVAVGRSGSSPLRAALSGGLQ
ncbi:hypothetical protein [Kordiimonas aestuarii]|uniref:hypothetical protein n=1 Tax=Kordiimonas aestuarii TaxID=1005925 RepID=UPI0021D0BCF2|nr:hypothetical protein [Kordiimonas aestuarii]